MENPPRSQFQDHKDVQGAERCRDHGEEVARHDHLGIVVDEGQPSLHRIWLSPGASFPEVFLYRPGRYPDPQLQFQFVGDAFLSPGGIVSGHL